MTNVNVKSVDNNKKSYDTDFDLMELAFDVLVPFILDNFVFKGTKGRLVKLVGTVAAQQLLKMLAKSQVVDDILDYIEELLLPEERKPAKPFPSLVDAVSQTAPKKYWNKSKPEDYYDPEREMFS
ncbi:MAG: hypothetical protein KDC31_02680 [Saprospiraceae bacterium]|jgi:hypothetical protein|nr:MAG: hypothetical protein UZ08_BCD001000527 [Candidatus Parvibacillus calidus]MBX2936022.1 hypothetical protein [Saprospiraceae bacterium]MBK7741496.1 hypothetical protein [Candidatus Parvibacillus calidus]MBX7180221.1 hypothetical protein [Saprospiraceae bacterium]MCB0590170.1 hypothetical protein [Saprospiraceae bacterium]